MKTSKIILLTVVLVITGCGTPSGQQLASCKMLASENSQHSNHAQSEYVKNCMISNGYEFIESHDLNEYSDAFGHEDYGKKICDDKFLSKRHNYEQHSLCYNELYDKLYTESRRWRQAGVVSSFLYSVSKPLD